MSRRILGVCLLAVVTLEGTWGAVQIPGDVIVGGLMPVHEKGDKTQCGTHVYLRGIQRVEAMLFAIDRINKNRTLLPGIKLGAFIVDSCSRDTYALNRSLEFIRASLNTLDTTGFECLDGSVPRPRTQSGTGPVLGVVGGSYSSVSAQVANLLRLFRIPQISPASTAASLSDKSRYEFFARTVPPDTYQAITLADLIQHMNWTYVSAIASEGSYGESGIEVFYKEVAKRNICIAVSQKIPSTAGDAYFDSVIRNLRTKKSAPVVVLFTRADDVRRILGAAKRLNVADKFLWVGSDGWGRQQQLVAGLEDVAEGSITVELESKFIPDFEDYFLSRTVSNSHRNPWFKDFWQQVFNCTLAQNLPPKTIQSTLPSEVTTCSPQLRLTPSLGIEQDSKVQFVIDAVYAFAHALAALQRDVCYGTSPCPALLSYDGGDFYRNYLLNVSFEGMGNTTVQFDAQGDGPARYLILNYQKLPNSTSYDYKVVGKWYHQLNLNASEIRWTGSQTQLPTSVCSLPCKVYEVKIPKSDICCWLCSRCAAWEYKESESLCSDCGPGRWPNSNKTGCVDLELEYMHWDSLFAIVPIVISVVGIIFTSSVMVLFVKFSETPIVKASGRELSFMLLGGILMCYVNTFALLAKPTIITCAVQRLCVGAGFSIIYGALLTKTNRISRIFDSASKSAKRPSFISPRSQLIISCSLISIQVGATLLWFTVEPPGTRYSYPQRDVVILRCKIEDSSFLVSQVYNMFLILVCTVYAVKTRKIPENFNESKFIGFTMYTTCIIWLAFLPIYFGTANTYEIQITTMCITISLSATVALVCLYSPKIYIIVFHPDKNVRKLTMNAAYRKPGGPAMPTPNNGIRSEAVRLHVVQAANSILVLPERERDSDIRNNGEQENTALL